VEFKIKKKEHHNLYRYKQEELTIAENFSNEIEKELGDFIKAIVLFGSSTRKNEFTPESDIDILIIVDDIKTELTAEFVEAYRIIVEKIAFKISKKLHITTMKLTNFWEYVRAGDPIIINILRDGVPLIDTGFFEPLQILLREGRIRPTMESVWVYFSRAPATLYNSKWHILQAVVDLYWAIIDSAHAALMAVNEIPPTPSHVADLLKEKMAKKGLIKQKYINTMKKFYELSKKIIHREIREIKGKEFDKLYKEADEFVDAMRMFIDEKQKQEIKNKS